MNYDTLDQAILTRFKKLGYTEIAAKTSLLEIWREWDRLNDEYRQEKYALDDFEADQEVIH